MTDRIALITGAATGIGAAVATSLAESGVKVAVCDINRQEGEKLAKAIGGEFIRCDVSRLENVQAAVNGCFARFGAPDYVHLNAGIMTVPPSIRFWTSRTSPNSSTGRLSASTWTACSTA